jgi:hypothetical protein
MFSSRYSCVFKEKAIVQLARQREQSTFTHFSRRHNPSKHLKIGEQSIWGTFPMQRNLSAEPTPLELREDVQPCKKSSTLHNRAARVSDHQVMTAPTLF